MKNKKEKINNKQKNEIFYEAKSDYNKLKILFEKDWINKLDKNIKNQLLNIIMKLTENQIEDEFILLKEYLNINIIDNLNIELLKDEIMIYAKKKEINDIIDDFVDTVREKELYNNISNSLSDFKDHLLLIKNSLTSKENLYDQLEIKNKDLLEENIKIKKINENLENKLKQLNKVNDELCFEKENNKNLQIKINDLSKTINEGKENIQVLFDKLNSEIKTFNNASNRVNEFQLKNEIEIRNKRIDELKLKLSRYPFELNEGEEIITVIFSPKDEEIILPVFSKNTDRFSQIENQLYELYPEYKEDNIFMVNGRVINKDNNLIENGINNKNIIYFAKKQ